MKKLLHYSIVLGTALACVLACSTFAQTKQNEKRTGDSAQQQGKPRNIYTFIKNQHYPALAGTLKKESEAEKSIAKQNAEQMANFAKKQNLTVTKIEAPAVGNAEKINLMYLFFALSKEGRSQYPEILHENVFKDLEVLCGQAPEFTRHVFSKLNYTTTAAGNIQLQKMLCTPSSNIGELTKKQQIIKVLVAQPKLRKQLEEQLEIIRSVENEFMWFWKEIQEEVFKYFESAYFQWSFLKDLDTSETALEGSTLFTFAGPIWPFVSTQLATFFYIKILKSVKILPDTALVNIIGQAGSFAFLSLLLGSQYLFAGVNIFAPAINQYNICDALQKKMMNIAGYIRAVNEMGSIISSNPELKKLLPQAKDLASVGVLDDEAKELLATLQKSTFKGNPSFFSNYGRVLASFKIMQDVKSKFVNGLVEAGNLDAYVSLARLYEKHATGTQGQFCFVDFINADKPYISAERFWHPMLNPQSVITNDLTLGTKDTGHNIILTGPNAGGKSTSLKAITLCLWLAQATGMAPASHLTMTPFSKINTYLNITDTEGRESLFQAEMNRAQSLLESIKQLTPSQFSFVIMDEIFTGTNPQEGEAGAYGIAKHLSKFANNMTIVATHFKELTNLEATTNGSFRNYKVSVLKENGRFVYPYKLEHGISDQPIALQLLEQQGFDSEILQEAKEIMEKYKN